MVDDEFRRRDLPVQIVPCDLEDLEKIEGDVDGARLERRIHALHPGGSSLGSADHAWFIGDRITSSRYPSTTYSRTQ